MLRVSQCQPHPMATTLSLGCHPASAVEKEGNAASAGMGNRYWRYWQAALARGHEVIMGTDAGIGIGSGIGILLGNPSVGESVGDRLGACSW